ncbi:HisA/HisF-related TIM barrel protein [Paludisphaera rhizosphaerae]|uniref:HisA/HisF-related TIM barrel protein n=1 Tax=Paludisphaera rhizosphaerae TaxID=2711216 RepID=UPI0013ECFE14|nr:HisA/HisF-related TIM barrel protein [Paludisphaera rhizosphaerae]
MASDFQLVPVLDVLNGRAVLAVGGERSRYRPVRSILHAGCDPRNLAQAFRDELNVSTVYVADLDSITRRERNGSLYDDLLSFDLDVWIDPGLRDANDLRGLPTSERLHLIAGMESLASPRALTQILDQTGPDRLIVSLDLRQGRPILANPEAWECDDAAAIASRIIAIGGRRLILLDLARVGRGSGTGTNTLFAEIHAAHPDIEVAVGGGVASMADVLQSREIGAAAVLVGSALHDGRIGRQEVRLLRA